MWKNKSTQLPNTPGVDFVGKIMNIDPRTSNRYGLAINDRVISLSNFGGNARYISTVSSKLVKVPASIDPVKAVCLAETYLAAFQTLHHGQDNSVRYMKSSMKRKSILVCGSLISNLGHALAQLSKIAGVENIFATSKPKYFKQLESMGFIPLNVDSILWLDKLKGCLDLVISLDEPIVSLYLKSLKSSGELVVVSNAQNPILPQNKFNIVCDRRKSQERSKIYYYDVYERWELDLERSKRDLSHLLKSLDKNEFQPHIIDRIPLAKVAKAHELIGSKRLPGFVVCEPWLVKKAKVISL